MKKIPKKYIPFICLALMIFFSWIEESLVAEGKFHTYLYEPNHVILRSFLRITQVLFLFVVGYVGLKTFSIKWIVTLWIFWYALILITAGINKVPLILFHQPMPTNIWSFLATFYVAALSPFPYLFLWFLSIITKRKLFK